MSTWLIDTSAVHRLGRAADPAYWSNAVTRGLVRTSSVTRPEFGYSARSGDALTNETGRPPLSAMPTEYQTPSIEDRSLEVQLLLADRGTHRAPSIADLIVAATAEIAGPTVLHVDKDFEMIAQLTGQDVERLVTT